MAWGGIGSVKHGIWKKKKKTRVGDKLVKFFGEKLDVFSTDIILGFFLTPI